MSRNKISIHQSSYTLSHLSSPPACHVLWRQIVDWNSRYCDLLYTWEVTKAGSAYGDKDKNPFCATVVSARGSSCEVLVQEAEGLFEMGHFLLNVLCVLTWLVGLSAPLVFPFPSSLKAQQLHRQLNHSVCHRVFTRLKTLPLSNWGFCMNQKMAFYRSCGEDEKTSEQRAQERQPLVLTSMSSYWCTM